MPLSQAGAAPAAVDPRPVDVAVIGAGPAGATAARCLAGQGAQVLLVERPGRRPLSVGESLPPAARPLLASLGLAERFAAAGHLPSYGNRSAWGGPELADTDFLFDPDGHGWHLDRSAFDAMLVAAAQEHGARRTCATAASWQPGASGGTLRLRQATSTTTTTTVRADALLDCTGRAAAVAQRLGARRAHHDRLVALAAVHTPRIPGDVDSRTLVEASPDGWWYTALLPGDRRVFVYLTDGDLVDGAGARDGARWLARLRRTEHLRELQERFQYQLTAGPALFPAGSSELEPVGHGSWLAAGDAAISFDPLSSQGIVTAMATGQAAATAILGVLTRRPGAAAWYRAIVGRIAQDYLDRRAHHYAHEHRWTSSPFWRRRSAQMPRGGRHAHRDLRRQAGREDPAGG